MASLGHNVIINLLSSDLSIDAMDVSGEQQIDVDHNMYKQRLDNKGDPIRDRPIKESKYPRTVYHFMLDFCSAMES